MDGMVLLCCMCFSDFISSSGVDVRFNVVHVQFTSCTLRVCMYAPLMHTYSITSTRHNPENNSHQDKRGSHNACLLAAIIEALTNEDRKL